jgi:hypothetical protein
MKSSISRSAAWLFTTRGQPPDEVLAALDDKTEAVIREPEVAVEDPEVGRFVAAVAVGSRVISESSVRVRMMPAYPTPVDLRCPICMSVLR